MSSRAAIIAAAIAGRAISALWDAAAACLLVLASLRLAELHRFEQVVTSPQHRSHFLRHVNQRPHAPHIFCGRSCFLTPAGISGRLAALTWQQSTVRLPPACKVGPNSLLDVSLEYQTPKYLQIQDSVIWGRVIAKQSLSSATAARPTHKHHTEPRQSCFRYYACKIARSAECPHLRDSPDELDDVFGHDARRERDVAASSSAIDTVRVYKQQCFWPSPTSPGQSRLLRGVSAMNLLLSLWCRFWNSNKSQLL